MMSIPIKFQTKLDVEAEGKNWKKIFMLSDGSIYAIEKPADYYDAGEVQAINRSFAGHLLREKKKKIVAEYHNQQASATAIRQKIKTLQHRLTELVGLTTKSAYTERLERQDELTRAKAQLVGQLKNVEKAKEKVAEIERMMAKFKNTIGGSTRKVRVVDPVDAEKKRKRGMAKVKARKTATENTKA